MICGRFIKQVAWLIAVIQSLLIVASRKHYTVDVVVAWFVSLAWNDFCHLFNFLSTFNLNKEIMLQVHGELGGVLH